MSNSAHTTSLEMLRPSLAQIDRQILTQCVGGRVFFILVKFSTSLLALLAGGLFCTDHCLILLFPAVVVPSMLALQEKGYGVAKGIPTLVIAASSVDNVFAISAFTVLLGITFKPNTKIVAVIFQVTHKNLKNITVYSRLQFELL